MTSALRFASCYVCSPAGVCAASRRSRLLRMLLKCSDAAHLQQYALRVRREAAESEAFADFFCAGMVLIPVPGSEPARRRSTSAAERLATALLAQGLGTVCWPGLHRCRAVRKSSRAPPGARPTVGDHYESFRVENANPSPRQILLIDDVVSKGRTLLAAAIRVREAFPESNIRAFALVRTLGLVPEIERLLEPCVGEIRWRHGDAYRCP